jgi:hypothetical protein
MATHAGGSERWQFAALARGQRLAHADAVSDLVDVDAARGEILVRVRADVASDERLGALRLRGPGPP